MTRVLYTKKNQSAKTTSQQKLIGVATTINSQSVTVLERDSAGNVLRCTGTVDITAAGAGYAKGCVYIKTSATGAGIFVNTGTTSSCAFAGADSYSKTTTIATAAVLTLNSTPVELVPAPGAGKVVIVDRIVATINYNSAAYATNVTMEFRYTDGSGTKVTADIAALLDATADKVVTVGGIEAALVGTINAAVVVRVATGNPATGNSPVAITTYYRIVDAA